MDNASSTVRPHTFSMHHVEDLCVVAPDPELNDELKEQFHRLRENAPRGLARQFARQSSQHVGLNDGLIYPGTYYPTGTTAAVAQRAALERSPLRGTVRVIVVLADFSDRQLPSDAQDRFETLFFSQGELPHGSVTEYFTDVSGGLVTITGEVVGPYRMPETLATYAGTDNGTQPAAPNARTMADAALTAANADVDFTPYDNDGNGYVDAFIVVHAGRGAEQTNEDEDIWSHKWVLPTERAVDGTKAYAYLTIAEDAKIGVCAHEMGHLVFGWPDLYDTDYSSEGVGNWCLMGGGSWGLGGDRPTHPSAWCKLNQGWATTVVQDTNATVTINDIKSSRKAYRLWKDGNGGNEYFLVENRQQDGYDASLPGGGLLVWHIDEAVDRNTDESHYKVGLLQADGDKDLELNMNRGDEGDPFPGTSGNTAFTDRSTPSSKSFAGSDTCVSITGIPASSPAMSVRLGVRCLRKFKEIPDKHLKEGKDRFKEGKEKDVKEGKDRFKEIPDKRFKEGKDRFKEGKEKDVKEIREKDLKEIEKHDSKEFKEGKEFPEDKFFDNKLADRPWQPRNQSVSGVPHGGPQVGDDLGSRMAALEAIVQQLAEALGAPDANEAWGAGTAEPFIGSAERPDLGHDSGGPDLQSLRSAMEAGSTEAKDQFDNLPPQ